MISTLTSILITIGIFSLVLAIHEGAHAYYMWRAGVPIERAGLGMPVKPMLTWQPKFLPFPITFSWLLIGAYVEPTETGNEQIINLPHKERSLIYGGGVIWNLTTGAFAGLLWMGLALIEEGGVPSGRGWTIIGVCSAILLLTLLFKRFIAAYTFPVLGTLVLLYLIFVFLPGLFSAAPAAAPGGGIPGGGGGELVGPVGIVQLGSAFTALLERVYFFAILSLNLALLNMLPMMPLDGGRIINVPIANRFGQRTANIHTALTMIPILLLIAFAIFGDFARLF